jgi:hypothetical protein
MELTPEQQSSIDDFNRLGTEITDSGMRHFFESWFSNMRELIRASFHIRPVKELADRLSPLHKTFVVLGSGPSVTEICRRLPKSHGAVFCGPTAIGALTREGITPTAIIVADSKDEQYRHVVESRLSRPDLLNVVLPVNCHPSWYDNDTVLNRNHLFFYLPYVDFMGSVDIEFNVIMKCLFPEVGQYIKQAGSVAQVAVNFASMCCAQDPAKRIYIGVDCCWLKGGPLRAPLRFEPEKHGKVLKDFWENTLQPRDDLIEIPYGDQAILTDIIGLTYGIQLFNLIHTYERDAPYAAAHYVLIDVASKLYSAAAPDVDMPLITPEDTNLSWDHTKSESWAFKVLIGLAQLLERYRNGQRQKLADKILHDWREKPEVQNIVDTGLSDFEAVVRLVHAVEPTIQFRFNGQDVELKEKENA